MSAPRRASISGSREQVGTFPLLNPKEIIVVFQELLQREVDPLILTEPLDPQKVRELYQDIVLVALDLAPDQLDTPQKDAAPLLEYQQLHNQSVAEINLWRKLCEQPFKSQFLLIVLPLGRRLFNGSVSPPSLIVTCMLPPTNELAEYFRESSIF